MTAVCVDCAETLSLGRRLLGYDRCPECEAKRNEEERKQRETQQAAFDQAVDEYDEVLDQLRVGADLAVVLPRVQRAAQVTPLAKDEVTQLHQHALSDFFAQLAGDDLLTKQEDIALSTVAHDLGVRLSPDESRRYVIAACNAGLMPRDPRPQIMLNQGEIAFQRVGAGVLSEHVVKEYRMNYQSLSIPVGNSGMRYRAGQARGRQVVVGTSIEVDDRGWLSVTNQRVVFSGTKQVMEFPLHRLVGLSILGNGLGLQIANRKSVPTFRTGAGINDVLAAVINTAVALDRGTFASPQVAAPPALETPPVPPLLAQHGYTDGGAKAVPETQRTPASDRSLRGDPPPGHLSEEVITIFEQLDKFPGQPEHIAQAKALYQLGGGSREDLETLLDRCYEAAKEVGLPPSLTPYRLADLPRPDRSIVREVPDSIEDGFMRLADLGLTPTQVDGLREDYRRELVEQPTLRALEGSLSDWDEQPGRPSTETADVTLPAPPIAETLADPASPPTSQALVGEAVLVYQRTGEGTRTREVLDVLASSDQALTPEEIGHHMRPEDEKAIPKGSVRASIRNVKRVEKNLREAGSIGRDILIVDWSAYATEGSNRYSLSPSDKAAILRLG